MVNEIGVPEDTSTLINQFASEPGVEGERLDFKSRGILAEAEGRRKLIKTLTALANSGGGTVIIGVRRGNDKELIFEDFDPDEEIKRDLSHVSKDRTKPVLTDFWNLNFERHTGKIVLRIDVSGVRDTLVEFRDEEGYTLYHRVGDTTQEMSHSDIKRFYQSKNNVLWEFLSKTGIGYPEVQSRPRSETSFNEQASSESIRTEDGAINIVSMLPITGDLGAFGPGMQKGIELAIRDINGSGGVRNHPIELIKLDTETAVEPAIQKYKNLVQGSGVPAVIGAASSGISVPLAEHTSADRIFQMSPASTTPTLSDIGYNTGLKYSGRTAPNDAQQGVTMGWIFENVLAANSASILHINNPYGEKIANYAVQEFSGSTYRLISYSSQSTDYHPTLDKIVDNDPDVIGVIGYPEGCRDILKTGADMDVIESTQWVLSEGLNSPEFFDQMGDLVENMVIASPSPVSTEGKSKFERSLGEQPPVFSPHSYDAMFLIALAIEKAGEFSGTAIAKNIRSISRSPGEPISVGEFDLAKRYLREGNDVNYEGASGMLNLTEKLEPVMPMDVLQITGGGTSVVDSLPDSFFEEKI